MSLSLTFGPSVGLRGGAACRTALYEAPLPPASAAVRCPGPGPEGRLHPVRVREVLQEARTTAERRKGRHRKAAPLPTLPYPEVTRFSIVAPRPKVSVRVGDSEMVVETDADSRFDEEGRVAVRTEPNCLEQSGEVPLTGAAAGWRTAVRRALGSHSCGARFSRRRGRR